MIEKKEVTALINSGFDLELISFELNIPIEQVMQCKKDIEKNKVKTKNNKPNTEYLEMEKMREKYRQLYWGDNRSKIVQPKPLPQKDKELVDTVLATIEDRVKEMKGLEMLEKRHIATIICSELKKIKDILKSQLSLEQAKRFYELMHSDQLKGLNRHIANQIDSYMKTMRDKSQVQLSSAINYEKDRTNSISQLQELANLITPGMQNDSYIAFGTLKSIILRKIESIQQQMVGYKLSNDIPESIKSIILDLVKGDVDIQRASAIIDEEADRRLSSRPQPRFGIAITKEDEREQVFHQISTAIEENAKTYAIENPQKTIEQLQELFGWRIEQSVRTVVENLITRKKFNEAKSICEEYIEKFSTENLRSRHASSNNLSSIRSLSNRVRNAEISDIVMTALEKQGTHEEERAYFKFIKRLLEEGNINPSVISLGKSKDGRRNITLADVCSVEWTR